jgi:hypothetical protein
MGGWEKSQARVIPMFYPMVKIRKRGNVHVSVLRKPPSGGDRERLLFGIYRIEAVMFQSG